jgi:hypothetical protein
MKKRNVQTFGGTQKYFAGTSGFRGTQVEKHCLRQCQYQQSSNNRQSRRTQTEQVFKRLD